MLKVGAVKATLLIVLSLLKMSFLWYIFSICCNYGILSETIYNLSYWILIVVAMYEIMCIYIISSEGSLSKKLFAIKK